MRVFAWILAAMALGCLCLYTGCNDNTTAETDSFISQISGDADSSATGEAAPDAPHVINAGLVPEEEGDNLSAEVDFGKPAMIELEPCDLKVNGDGTMSVIGKDGATLSTFTLDANGKMVVAGGKNAGGFETKSCHVGPPADPLTAYRVYGAGYQAGKGMKPVLQISHYHGMVEVTPGDQVEKKYNPSRGKTRPSGGSSGAACSVSSGG